eukprot:1535333-Prymnesium_polylepis.1
MAPLGTRARSRAAGRAGPKRLEANAERSEDAWARRRAGGCAVCGSAEGVALGSAKRWGLSAHMLAPRLSVVWSCGVSDFGCNGVAYKRWATSRETRYSAHSLSCRCPWLHRLLHVRPVGPAEARHRHTSRVKPPKPNRR